jgi:uncharacterized protein (TIGR04255 family)
MSATPVPLPDFENPPVSEVALSVEFLPLANWRSPHAGLYWARLKLRYPHTEVHPAILSQIERFGDQFWQPPTVQVQLGNPDIARSWFLAEPKTHLIQVQRDRFVINWRKVLGDEKYPRYVKEMRPRFEQEWNEFKSFVTEQDVGEISVQQCEITYVNDIVQGDGWSQFQEALALFSYQWAKRSEVFLPMPETLAITGSFLMPKKAGRLHIIVQHLRRQIDNREAVQLTLTARGKPASGTDDDVLAWMDLGHEWIVRAFGDLTSDQAHKLWKRRN